jgi:hypothetical protein
VAALVLRSWARPAIGAVLLFALLLGCKKPEDDLGLEVLDPSDALGTTVVDTTTILTWSAPPDAGRTSGLTRNVLGTYLDPDFGAVSAGVVAQVRLSSGNVGANNTDALDCDSLVLSLAFDANLFGYGNLDARSFRVFRLNEDLRTDTIYKNDHVPAVLLEDLVALPRGEITPAPFTKPFIDGDSLTPQLRIRLSKELGQELLSKWGQTELSDNPKFLEYFKGLMILPGEQPGTPFTQGLLYLSLLSADSKLTLYYRNTTVPDTLSYNFPINTTSVRYTVSSFDHQAALQPGLPALLLDSALGQQQFYLQALYGLKGQLYFPHLLDYPASGHRALAKAEIIIPLAGTYYPSYLPPSQLFVFRKDATGKELDLPGQTLGTNLVGGFYDEANGEYRLVVTQWMQKVLDGDMPNLGLSLYPGGSGVSANRVVLAGPANATKPMKLRLTFTTY